MRQLRAQAGKAPVMRLAMRVRLMKLAPAMPTAMATCRFPARTAALPPASGLITTSLVPL